MGRTGCGRGRAGNGREGCRRGCDGQRGVSRSVCEFERLYDVLFLAGVSHRLREADKGKVWGHLVPEKGVHEWREFARRTPAAWGASQFDRALPRALNLSMPNTNQPFMK